MAGKGGWGVGLLGVVVLLSTYLSWSPTIFAKDPQKLKTLELFAFFVVRTGNILYAWSTHAKYFV